MHGSLEETGDERTSTQSWTPRFSPKTYRDQIRWHASTSIRTSLYPGENFNSLNLFLDRVPRPDSGSASSEKDADEEFAIFHRLDSDDQKPTPQILNRLYFQPKTDHLLPNQTGVIWLRGYPCTQSLLELGAAYDIDPEFYRRHLSFLDTELVNDDATLLPSYNSTMFQLTVTTVGHHITQNYDSLLSKRLKCARQMDSYLKGLREGRVCGRSWRPSESVIRSFAIHDLKEFSMQQVISVYVSHHPDSSASRHVKWKAIVWTDGGADLNSSPPGPWNAMNLHCDPVTLYKPEIALKNHNVPKRRQSDRSQTVGQSLLLLPFAFGQTLNPKLMREDTFYAFTEIFNFFTASEMHFLNSIEKLVRRGSRQSLEDLQQSSIENFLHADLSFFKKLLEDHIEIITQTETFVKNSPHLRWPNSNSKQASRASHKIETDLAALLKRAEQLRERCSSGMRMVLDNLQIGEAKKAMDQAKRTHTLTMLATLFLPATATGTVFGMNFVQFSTTNQGVWAWFVVTVPVLVFSYAIVAHWSLRGIFAVLKSSTGVYRTYPHVRNP